MFVAAASFVSVDHEAEADSLPQPTRILALDDEPAILQDELNNRCNYGMPE